MIRNHAPQLTGLTWAASGSKKNEVDIQGVGAIRGWGPTFAVHATPTALARIARFIFATRDTGLIGLVGIIGIVVRVGHLALGAFNTLSIRC